MTTIHEDTSSYEEWLSSLIPLNAEDLAFKHSRMADEDDPFPFFRGAYYRWLRHWRKVCSELKDAPNVLSVGDLHVENFGTWRDSEGRLAWGVNDFDETATMPYANDLVRLACSVKFARKAGPLAIRTGSACEAILRGYTEALKQGGRPFVLEESHPQLRSAAYAQEHDPVRFWKRLTRLLLDPAVEVPKDARLIMLRDLPSNELDCQYRFRPRIGMGSLGKPRFILLAEWSGGWVAREAKAVTAPATRWLARKSEPGPSRMAEIVKKAVRSHDPYYQPEKAWTVRRIAPRCSKIGLAFLTSIGDQLALLEAMGAETANIHLGSAKAVDAILKDLEHRPHGWLCDASRQMYKALKADWKEWRQGSHAKKPSSNGVKAGPMKNAFVKRAKR